MREREGEREGIRFVVNGPDIIRSILLDSKFGSLYSVSFHLFLFYTYLYRLYI